MNYDYDNNKIKIAERLARIEEIVRSLKDDMRGTIHKLIYAICGLACATIGTKFLGTPPLLFTVMYIAWVAGVFLIGATIMSWRYAHWSRNAVRVSFLVLIFFSIIVRTFLYRSGIDVAPIWFSSTINILYTVLCIVLIISCWLNRR